MRNRAAARKGQRATRWTSPVLATGRCLSSPAGGLRSSGFLPLRILPMLGLMQLLASGLRPQGMAAHSAHDGGIILPSSQTIPACGGSMLLCQARPEILKRLWRLLGYIRFGTYGLSLGFQCPPEPVGAMNVIYDTRACASSHQGRSLCRVTHRLCRPDAGCPLRFIIPR